MAFATSGTTGYVGGRVAARLAEAGVDQRLIVRDTGRAPELAGAEAAEASYADPEALREALAGARIFFMVSGAEDRDGIKLLLEGLRDRLPRHHANGRGAPKRSPLSSHPAAWCGSHHVRRSLPSLADTA